MWGPSKAWQHLISLHWLRGFKAGNYISTLDDVFLLNICLIEALWDFFSLSLRIVGLASQVLLNVAPTSSSFYILLTFLGSEISAIKT